MPITAQVISDEEIDTMIDKDGMENAFRAWLKTRPENVQEFAAEHPYLRPGTILDVQGENLWFMGYGEYEGGGVGLIVTPINPSDDYEAAVEARQNICASCLI